MAAVLLLPPRILIIITLFLFLSPLSISSLSESEALLNLKKSFTNAASLDSWSTNSTSCSGNTTWVGVLCFNSIVTGLRLRGLGLSGKIDIDALLNLPGLRSVSFINNKFTGEIPEFNRLGALKAIYLSGNQFSGEIRPDYFLDMASLKKIWLSRNSFNGSIPNSLSKLRHLMELHLEDNHFSGDIPEIDQKVLNSFNVSNNELKGNIPSSYAKFDRSSFSGNSGLCGEQVGKTCEKKGDDLVNTTSSVSVDVKENKMDSGKGAAIGLAMLLVICLLGVAVGWAMKRQEAEFETLGRGIREDGVEVYVSNTNQRGLAHQKGMESGRNEMNSGKKAPVAAELVVVNSEKGVFGLPDLMKAGAEVLGNGGLGSTYKAVMGNGMVVVVKRMREMNRVGHDGFEAEVRRLGKLRHQNVLPPLAFHYRKEEKLLVYEYIPKGSLLYLLHGDRGPCHAELDWPARLKIVRGIGRGMAYLHAELPNSDLPHGNLKSCNVFLDPDLEPLLSDFGFSPLVSPTQAVQSMFAYKAPESIQYQHVSPKSDVYCLGILILEILTGKFPSQYLTNGKGGTDIFEWVVSAISERREAEVFDPEIAGSETARAGMGRLLHLGAACADLNTERRPDMREAVKRIEDIVADEGSKNEKIGSAPSLRDSYSELASSSSRRSHALNIRDGYGENSSRRSRAGSFSERGSGRRNGDNFASAIS
ncbi:pollen receptor-like kinase 3 [Tasmannia lanceolata]|uniref:pollen receptor-like kinase 3 n=1 Tax=Tasmannia lanceolata TaxID=3420 RepID=UPI0040638D4C